MIDTKQMAKYIFEEYANCYSEVDIEQLAKHLDEIKTEAVKEFAERLKEKTSCAKDVFDYTEKLVVDVEEIDNALKEMESKNNE